MPSGVFHCACPKSPTPLGMIPSGLQQSLQIMPALDIPFFGTLVLSLTLISASYTMAVSIGAGRGRSHLLPAARWGTYATCALVLVAVCVLAYAFQVHDFRIRYVF